MDIIFHKNFQINFFVYLGNNVLRARYGETYKVKAPLKKTDSYSEKFLEIFGMFFNKIVSTWKRTPRELHGPVSRPNGLGLGWDQRVWVCLGKVYHYLKYGFAEWVLTKFRHFDPPEPPWAILGGRGIFFMKCGKGAKVDT